MQYQATSDRYDQMHYRLCGLSGLSCRSCRWGCGITWATRHHSTPSGRWSVHAFDLGITHFDPANDYGPSGIKAVANADGSGTPPRPDVLSSNRDWPPYCITYIDKAHPNMRFD
jgi:hypothetical protein